MIDSYNTLFGWLQTYNHTLPLVFALAKQGAQGINNAISGTLKLSGHEMCSLLDKCTRVVPTDLDNDILSCNRNVVSLMYRLRLNSWKTKFVQNVCICSSEMSIHHIFFECPILLAEYQKHSMDLIHNFSDAKDILYSKDINIVKILQLIISSPVGRLL